VRIAACGRLVSCTLSLRCHAAAVSLLSWIRPSGHGPGGRRSRTLGKLRASDNCTERLSPL
jgi:hypothetical protein